MRFAVTQAAVIRQLESPSSAVDTCSPAPVQCAVAPFLAVCLGQCDPMVPHRRSVSKGPLSGQREVLVREPVSAPNRGSYSITRAALLPDSGR